MVGYPSLGVCPGCPRVAVGGPRYGCWLGILGWWSIGLVVGG